MNAAITQMQALPTVLAPSPASVGRAGLMANHAPMNLTSPVFRHSFGAGF